MNASVFYAGALVLGAIYYASPTVPCQSNIQSALVRPALHANTMHLIGNLTAFFILTRSIQPRIGIFNYVLLIAFLWVTTAMMDVAFQQTCSIGFSGVVLGLLVWDLFDRGQLKWDLAAAGVLAAIWLEPMAQGQNNVSMSGHFYGLVAGLLATGLTRMVR